MNYLSAGLIAATCAIVCSSPAAAQSTTLTATFAKGAIAEHSGNANRTDNGALFSSLNISSFTISQLSNNGVWGGSQGNDTSVTAKITFTNGSFVTFPAAINWVRNAGGGGFDWIGLTIGAGTTVSDGYNLTAGKQKTYILAFSQSSQDLSALLPNELDGSANAGQALEALNLYFPTAVASPPIITGPSGGAGATASAISVNENQTAVTTLTANKAVTWDIIGGTEEGKFTISPGGVLTFVAAPDFETPTDSDRNNTYVLIVEATDSNGGKSTQTVTVTVLNLEDQAPLVTPNQAFNYAENRAANDSVATVGATDNVAVTAFRFGATGTQVSADGYYTIDNAGVIRITAAGVAAGVANNDFEIAPNSFTYAVQAGDATGAWSASANVVLNVTNLDDTGPVVAAGQSFTYAENRASGALLGTVAASDDTGVTGFRFTSTGTAISGDGFFTIDNSGKITLTAAGAAAAVPANNFELAPNSFVHGVEARDAAGNWSSSIDITLNVSDLDDTAPVIGGGQSFSYAENQSANAVIGTIVAADDVAVTAYRFAATATQTSADGYYTIDTGGVLRITAAGAAAGLANNDFEIAPNSFSYGIQTGDAAGNWSVAANVTLNVTDVSEAAPNAAPTISAGQKFSYAENRSANALIGTMVANDDAGVTAFRFAATGTQTSSDGYYTIDNDGALRITAAGAAAGVANNDFETSPNSFSYAIEAGDAEGLWSAASSVTLEVTDLDDTAPQIAAGQRFIYAENRAADAVLGTISASDAVGVTGFRFAATGTQTSADGYYTVDNGGLLRITAAGVAAGVANNDFETSPNSFSYAIEAGDAGGQWSAAANIAFEVTDLDDTAPQVPAGQSFAYPENQAANAVLGTVTASDAVGVTAFRFAGTGTQTSADGYYAIDNAGVLRITAAGAAAGLATNDFEIAPNSFSYGIEAGDAAGNWSSAATMTLNVTDRPDTPPVLTGPGGSTGPTASISVPEGTTSIVQITANVSISSWDIVGGNDRGRFQIDGNGNLRFLASPDFEAPADTDTNNSYVLVIEGTDANGNKTSQTITITVTDVDDTPPQIAAGQSFAYSENQAANGVVGTVSATDAKGVTAFRFAVTGTQTSADGYYTIDNSGVLRITAAGVAAGVANNDFEIAPNSFTYGIQAGDAAGNWSSPANVSLNVTDRPDTPPAITGPSGGAGAAASAISVNEGTTTVTTMAANVPVTWSIVGGNDRGQFSLSASGALTFVAAPNFEAPTDSDGNNSYVLIVEARDINGNVSRQTVTVTVLNVDELQRKLNEIGGKLRANIRSQVFSSLSTMLSFNEGLLGLDGRCSNAGAKPVSGGVNANEQQQDASLRFARDLSSCESRTRVLVDGGVGFSRVEGEWSTRGLASFRVEQRIGLRTALGAALIGTAADDDLASFADSKISDRSLQLNVYGRTHLSPQLRFAAFAGLGRSWYDFKLEDGGLVLSGDASGKRHLYGAALSGDIDLGGFTVTTDAILSRAVEKLGSASLDGSFGGESRSGMLFRVGNVDITRFSVPVHVPIVFKSPADGRDPTRLDISPGLICQDTAQDSSSLDCGYQLGFKFRLAPTVRSRLRAEARAESVDGYLLSSFAFGFQRRFGSADQLAWGVDVSRQARSEQADNRMMVRVGLGR